jgi:hypothetical protein
MKENHLKPHMFNASNDNSKTTIESSLIESSKLNEIPNSLSFKFRIIIAFKASKSNQCP